MAKRKKSDMTKVRANEVMAPPTFMGDDRTGTELIRSYVIPPRLKFVQKQSDDKLLAEFDVGTLLVSPSNMVIASGEDEKFILTPLFFFVEYCTWNHISQKGKLPAIRERSFDPKGEIAIKSRDPETRQEDTPGLKDVKMRHVEHLNFIVRLVNHTVTEDIILSFSRGDHGAGRTFCSLIQMRKAPLFGCKFVAVIKKRENDMGSWFGLDMKNPSEDDGEPWVEEDDYEVLKAAHESFREIYANANLRVDYAEDEGEPTDDNDNEM